MDMGKVEGADKEDPDKPSKSGRDHEVFLDPEEEDPTLLIPEVVVNVLKFVNDPQTLANCRLVCRTWNAVAIPFVREKTMVTFTKIPHIESYSITMDTSPDIPYTNFCLDLVFKGLDMYQADVVNTFLTTYGPGIAHLKLILNEKNSNPGHWWTLLYNCMNLERLSIVISKNIVTGTFGPGDGGFTLFTGEYFEPMNELAARAPFAQQAAHQDLAMNRHQVHPLRFEINTVVDVFVGLVGPIAPKLQLKIKHVDIALQNKMDFINLNPLSSFFSTIFLECEATLASVSCSPPVPQTFGNMIVSRLLNLGKPFPELKDLKVWFSPSLEHFDELPRLVSLQRLKLCLGSWSNTELDWLQNLWFQAACPILHLEVMFPPLYYIPFPPTPPLVPLLQPTKILKSLKIHGDPQNKETCLWFLQSAPRSEVLEVRQIDLKAIIDHLSASRENVPWKSVKIFQSSALMEVPEVFSRMTYSFHEVVFLEVTDVTNRTLDLIYQTMPNLRELNIAGTFSDEGISGIPQKHCDEIRKLETHYITGDAQLRQYVYIGSLSKLKRLSISSNSITDISVIFGLAGLQKLEDLVISGDLITDRSAEAIKNFMAVCTVDVSACKNLYGKRLTASSMQHWWDELLLKSKRRRLNI